MTDSRDLFTAVRSGDLVRVLDLLRRSPRLVSARDQEGATALHYATEGGNRAIVQALLDAGADINARDSRFEATPAGWAIEYLRQRGGLLGIEIEDTVLAITLGDAELVRRFVTRLPALRHAVGKDGTPLKDRARASGNSEIASAFGV